MVWLKSVVAGIAAMVVLAVGPAFAQSAYSLGPGDVIRVTVFGEPDLSGEFEVGAGGGVSLPLVGETMVEGMNINGAESTIESKLAEGFVLNPDVSIDVLNYRPFFIMGEVNNQGTFPYEVDLTVLKAVAIAGGFTLRADKDDITVKVGGVGEDVPVELDTVVSPGDIITVEERWF